MKSKSSVRPNYSVPVFLLILLIGSLFIIGTGGSSGGGGSIWYLDNDGDGYGDPLETTKSKNQPTGYVADNTDCDDSDAGINPGAAEIADDGTDQDCDGSDLRTWYLDNDGDRYGDSTSSTTSNVQPTGYVADNTDCDDSDDSVYPGATEIPDDGVDQDCTGFDLQTWYKDVDEDLYSDSTSQQAET
ncbi:MAG: putative metal-binding motif-containing protein, partial [Deltaproteobacteria bacterium]|nr:putative metal-binding motif-containing protein [Deltaproteobacteria bacterium]